MSVNRLAGQGSPYLLQHAHNPVDWYPWGDEALARASAEDKPILLSIGYSACHWCHVMAHESFDDAETAAVMNELFVNVKVDREERPDLDKIYQAAHQYLARRPGGWPLTVFLSPGDQVPFFAGTYFPPTRRHGLPSFREILRAVERAYREQRDAIEEQNGELLNVLGAMADDRVPGELNAAPVSLCGEQLIGQFDRLHGGFGGAPKFPHPPALEFLLDHAAEQARDPLLHTLRRMAWGGLNDHLGGGFFRYSVDERWMIPHFEKMLYDNGQLLALYAKAYGVYGDPEFRAVATATAAWALREMGDPSGGFYATLDADAAGREGGYYAWDRREVRRLLDPDAYRLA